MNAYIMFADTQRKHLVILTEDKDTLFLKIQAEDIAEVKRLLEALEAKDDC